MLLRTYLDLLPLNHVYFVLENNISLVVELCQTYYNQDTFFTIKDNTPDD